ncbi:AbrB/MazE/SpoVT family DNA-binding domain-containing protein [Magnetofaba australis]|uniref:Putative addiction module antidote n=1 Tax=Magnetofaba australis IT-1 TaxID=1434232 RepID=A0A1Y2KAC7_9PROT|nr:AbrB/MazE/SpoVT family DNA-binding domain-containing protein [Magnetofaba australis]OSM07657.1 putative addiction module antidote [Magnetofaba australis IT-1]
MTTLKLIAVGNSTGVVLPKELLARLRVEKGDSLFAVETPEGIELTAYDPEFARQMDVAEEIMREDRDVLKKLGS